MRKLLVLFVVLFCLGIVNLTFANGLSVPGVPSIGQPDVAMNCSGWSMTTGVYFPTGCSGGGGSPSYSYQTKQTTSEGSFAATRLVIVALYIQEGVSDVLTFTCGGTAMKNYATDGDNQGSLWYANVTSGTVIVVASNKGVRLTGRSIL